MTTAFWLWLAALIPYVLALAFYGWRSPWWRSNVGRGMFALYGSIVLVLVYAMLASAGILSGQLREIARAVTILLVQAAGWIQLANIIVVQIQNKPGDSHPRRRATDVY